MSDYAFTPEAAEDLFEIWRNIATANIQAADRLEVRVKKACQFLAEGPLHGHLREDLTKRPVRFWALPRYRNYIIVYEPSAKPLLVIRILHGARNVSAIL